MVRSVYERYGGFASINRTVIAFYDAVLESDRLASFFDGVDMLRLIDHQTKTVTALLGGPAQIADVTLEKSHRRLAISDGDFDELLAILRNTLLTEGFADPDIDIVVAGFEARRRLIVSVAK